MISRITGKLRHKSENSVLLDVNGVCYQILLPGVVMEKLDSSADIDADITLVTYHYMQTDPSKSIPVLIGFLTEIEKEFFEKFITVSGVGPKAACRALNMAFSDIAAAIDRGDSDTLKRLPGIGEQRSREIIAKLQGKVGKFGLMQDKGHLKKCRAQADIAEEATEVLLQLQYSKSEARAMIEKAIERNPAICSCEDILNEVYRQKQVKGHAG